MLEFIPTILGLAPLLHATTTMSNAGLCRMHFGHTSFDAVCSELSEGGPDFIGIVRSAKGCAEREQLIVRLESPDRGGHGQCFFERLFLERKVRGR
jgi:hypothetical protein